jgi:hypothetical protein
MGLYFQRGALVPKMEKNHENRRKNRCFTNSTEHWDCGNTHCDWKHKPIERPIKMRQVHLKNSWGVLAYLFFREEAQPRQIPQSCFLITTSTVELVRKSQQSELIRLYA